MNNPYHTTPCLIPLLFAATACNRNGVANTYGINEDTPIVSPTIAHMVTQIRLKQLSTQVSQNTRLAAIRTWLTQHPEVDDAHFIQKIGSYLEKWITESSQIDDYLDKAQEDRNKDEEKFIAEGKSEIEIINELGKPPLGWAIRCRKTTYLLEMVKPYISEAGLRNRVESGKLINGLCNEITTELPTLGSCNDQAYWGNGNHVLVSVILDLIYATWCAAGKKLVAMAGASTFYPFEDEIFRLPVEVVSADYPFASECGMLLYGEYQYGGHSYFKDRWLLKPEDCSSSVGKAIGLSHAQVEYIATKDMIAAYKEKEGAKNLASYYHCNKVTAFPQGEPIDTAQLKSIEPGDALLMDGHIAVVAENPNDNFRLTMLEFVQGLKSSPRVFGGGSSTYDLQEKVKQRALFFLRPITKPLSQPLTTAQLLNTIDSRFCSFYNQGIAERPSDYEQFFSHLYS